MSTDIRSFFKSEPISSIKKLEHILHRLDSLGQHVRLVQSFQKMLASLQANEVLIATRNASNKEATIRDIDNNLSAVLDVAAEISSDVAQQPAKKKRRTK